jgi:hypothetical protein
MHLERLNPFNAYIDGRMRLLGRVPHLELRTDVFPAMSQPPRVSLARFGCSTAGCSTASRVGNLYQNTFFYNGCRSYHQLVI